MELGVDVQSRVKHLQAQKEKKKAKDRSLEKLERQFTQMLSAGKLDDVEDLKEDLDTIKMKWNELDNRLESTEDALKGALPKLATFKSEQFIIYSLIHSFIHKTSYVKWSKMRRIQLKSKICLYLFVLL